MTTPEGKVKSLVREVCAEYGASIDCWMPVPAGYGESRLDFHICYRGRYIAVETKAPGRKPTDRQRRNIARLERAGAKVFVIDSAEGAEQLRTYLARLTLVGGLFGEVGL